MKSPGATTLPISVILPTYNRIDRLGRAVRSVLAQTCSPQELVVVDDASTDDIEGLLNSFNDPRIRYLRMPTRGGAGKARNHGAAEAKGDWIAFQDSDDEWLINKLELQWQAAEFGASSAALICGSYIIVPRRGTARLVAPTEAMQDLEWGPAARFAFPFIAPTWLLRRRRFLELGGFDVDLPNLEDWELSFRLHEHGGFRTIRDPLLVKHGSADGLNNDADRQVTSLLSIRERHHGLISSDPQSNTRYWLRLAYYSIRLGKVTQARRALAQTIAATPRLRYRCIWAASYFGLPLLRRMQRRLIRPEELG